MGDSLSHLDDLLENNNFFFSACKAILHKTPVILQSGMSKCDFSHGSTKDRSPISSSRNRNILIFPISIFNSAQTN